MKEQIKKLQKQIAKQNEIIGRMTLADQHNHDLFEEQKHEIENLKSSIKDKDQQIEILNSLVAAYEQTEIYVKSLESLGILKNDSSCSHQFSSKFMPNVKFTLISPICAEDLNELERILSILRTIPNFHDKYSAFTTSPDGSCLYNGFENLFDGDYSSCSLEEISIYEAIPELVPDGMVYDKESDSLIKVSDYIRSTVNITLNSFKKS